MTEDFVAGGDWIVRMMTIFTPAEVRLLWALKKADGRVVTVKAAGALLTGREHNCSDGTRVRICRMRHRARGLGYEIASVRGKGYVMVLVMGEAA